MFRLFRRLILLPFQLLPLIAVIVAAGLFVRTETIDPQHYAQMIADAVQREVGQNVTIEGGADIEFAWPPRLVLRDLRVRNPEWAGGRHMLRVERVEAELDPIELLFGRVEAPRARFIGAEIIMAENSRGTSNWGRGAEQGPGTLLALAMQDLGTENVELAGGRILLRDAGGDTRVVPLGTAPVVSSTAAARRSAGRNAESGHPCDRG